MCVKGGEGVCCEGGDVGTYSDMTKHKCECVKGAGNVFVISLIAPIKLKSISDYCVWLANDFQNQEPQSNHWRNLITATV